MKGLAFSAAMLFLVGSLLGQGAPSPADIARYGPYPTDYKDIIMKWLDTQLVDSPSARIEWTSEPKPTEYEKNGQHFCGYLVTFTINARNRFGTYTGKQSHGAVINNGAVIKGLGLGY